jgi:(1->4)-alpha-D-glucan 1-alpha-D-glucosylmutase
LNAKFTFDDAANISAYLKGLGISHVYCSPYLQAAPGSMHGYDVVDHQRVNDELGGEEGHGRFCARLAELGLGQVLDIVPNHMAIGAQNHNWWDVLENGPSSRFATWFDIDWHSSEVKLQNKVLIPVLGDQYGRVLAAGQIKIDRERGSFCIRYSEHTYPLAPRSVPLILNRAARRLNDPTLSFLSDSLMRLPLPESTDVDGIDSRHRDKVVIYDILKKFSDEHPEAAGAIDSAVSEMNADNDALDELLNLQHYRLAYWRTADQELGYRRFFDVNTLVGLRVERSHVFDYTHRRILDWLQEGVLDGVRVDHPDGLRDPLQYFRRLRQPNPDAWIIGEKILEPGEFLRENWPIQGTSGYDFLNLCNGWLTHPEGMKLLTRIYSDFTHQPTDFVSIAHEKKLNVEQEALGSDVNRLASLFVEICENNRDRRDYTRAEIRRAIREVAASFEVYRTYVVPDRDEIVDEDRRQVIESLERAKSQRSDLDAELFDFIGEVLTMRARGPLESEFVYRFQQFTSPVMAKGVEDTAFYCYNRMIGLNEVGSSPSSEPPTSSEFLEYCSRMQASHPATMTTLSTHDTKRSDDVRARLAVITEDPASWRGFLRHWSRQNVSLKTDAQPDRNTEYFLYQTMIGAWPIGADRLTLYMEKSVREAKQQTSWTQPNKRFEDALKDFIEQLYGKPEFVAAVEELVSQILMPGRVNSLTQTLLKCTAPGIPDTYQGSELWDLHLVDPDNRGPIDYELRQSLLSELESGIRAEEIMKRMDCGLPKLWILYRVLNLRRRRPELLGAEANFESLSIYGRKSNHAMGYIRAGKLATIVPRWTMKLEGLWSDTVVDLPADRWKNLLTDEMLNGGRIPIQDLFRRFPVALLLKEEN